MSSLEIITFNKNGDVKDVYEINNALKGAISIWKTFEIQYLEPMPIITFREGKPIRSSRLFSYDEEEVNKVWGIQYDRRLTDEERIILLATFDKMTMKKKDLRLLIDAIDKVIYLQEKSNILEQKKIYEKILEDDDVIAIAWNQTSIAKSFWINIEEINEFESKDYNYLTGTIHKDVIKVKEDIDNYLNK